MQILPLKKNVSQEIDFCPLFPFKNNIYISSLIDLFPTSTVKILEMNSIL